MAVVWVFPFNHYTLQQSQCDYFLLSEVLFLMDSLQNDMDETACLIRGVIHDGGAQSNSLTMLSGLVWDFGALSSFF